MLTTVSTLPSMQEAVRLQHEVRKARLRLERLEEHRNRVVRAILIAYTERDIARELSLSPAAVHKIAVGTPRLKAKK